MIYKKLYPSWYKSKLYLSWYEEDDHGKNRVLGSKGSLKLKMRHVKF